MGLTPMPNLEHRAQFPQINCLQEVKVIATLCDRQNALGK